MTSPKLHDGFPVKAERYSFAARANHWVNATLFILLILSGLAFYSPYLFFLTGLFGGGANTRMLHPWFGVAMSVSFLALFVRFARGNIWNSLDSRWLANVKYVLAGDDEKAPEVGKYNAGQKLVFWATSLFVVALLSSGLIIWDQYFFAYTGIQTKRIAILVHSIAATGAIIVLIIHIYAAFWIKGSLNAMTEGDVTGGWAWRHHRKWLRELAQEKNDAPARPN